MCDNVIDEEFSSHNSKSSSISASPPTNSVSVAKYPRIEIDYITEDQMVENAERLITNLARCML